VFFTVKNFDEFINESHELKRDSFKYMEDEFLKMLREKTGVEIEDLEIVYEYYESSNLEPNVIFWLFDGMKFEVENGSYVDLDSTIHAFKGFTKHLEAANNFINSSGYGKVFHDGSMKNGGLAVGLAIPFSKFTDMELTKSLKIGDKYNL
jgi:hypothetical protein